MAFILKSKTVFLRKLTAPRLDYSSWDIAGFLGLSGLAVFCGLFSAVIVDLAGVRALYYVAALVLVVFSGFVLVLSRQRESLIFTVSFLGLPIIATILPPGRLGVSIFDVMMLLVALVYFSRFVSGNADRLNPFFVSWHFSTAFLGLAVLVALSHFPLASLWVWFEILGIYVFFRCCVAFMRVENGFEKLTKWLGFVVLVMVLGVIFERVTHINLTLGGGNLNQNVIVNGEVVRRAAGFFQDPQRSAQFLASTGAFFFVLLLRKRFSGGFERLVVISSLLLCLLGLLLSGSRASMLGLLVATGVGGVFIVRSTALLKFSVLLLISVLAGIFYTLPSSFWLSVLPESIISRYENLDVSLEYRLHIWFDTWKMFSDQPLWGIGPGSFREYLRTTNPSATGYYGIGGSAGVEYIPDQPESGYLKILYEGGLIGVSCTLIIVFGAIKKVFGVLRRSFVTADLKTEALAAIFGLIVFSLGFVTLFTVADERDAAIFALLLAVIWKCAEQSRSAPVEKIESRTD